MQIGKDPVARTVLGEALVIFRGADGEAAALIDRCAHRNLALSRGKVTAEGLRCAYHGWTWGSDGHCTGIPSSCEPESCRAIRIKAYPVKEQQGFVWVWMAAAEATVPDRDPPPAASEKYRPVPEEPVTALAARSAPPFRDADPSALRRSGR